MNPNLNKTIEILTSKLATSELQSSQWQSIADDLKEETDQLQQEKEELNKRVEELEGHINEEYEPTEAVNLPHEVVKVK